MHHSDGQEGRRLLPPRGGFHSSHPIEAASISGAGRVDMDDNPSLRTHRCEVRVTIGVSTLAAARNLRAAAVIAEAALRSSAVRARLRVAERTVATRETPPDGRVDAAPTVRGRVETTFPKRGRAAEEARTTFIEIDALRCHARGTVLYVGAIGAN